MLPTRSDLRPERSDDFRRQGAVQAGYAFCSLWAAGGLPALASATAGPGNAERDVMALDVSFR
jgi:hypothetical protein